MERDYSGRGYNPAVAKIDPLRSRSRTAALGARKRKVGGAASGGGQRGGSAPQDVRPLIDQIDSAGNELARDPTGSALERYKRAVRGLLDCAVAECMQLQSESSAGFTRRVFSTITRVDIALSDMTTAVLGRQQDLLKLRGLLDQVKGLIVDLYR